MPITSRGRGPRSLQASEVTIPSQKMALVKGVWHSCYETVYSCKSARGIRLFFFCSSVNHSGDMDVSVNSYCTVLDKTSQSKFLCYTRRKDGMLSVCLTDAANVWSVEYTKDSLKHLGQRFALKSTEDYVLKLRASCNSGDVSVSVHEVGAELRLGSSPGDLSVTLSRLEGPQATDKLRELLFTMADSLTQLDSGPSSGPPSASPVKNQRRPTEFEPWQQQSSAPAMTMKRRLPGSSLINPGVKKKQQATGVAFDYADED
ncbi:protein PAXX [Maylandia zebra]|uniref:protein PAXX n=1 Tax=Maylandia zebra TaxID=106582 RepID=UPI00403D157C